MCITLDDWFKRPVSTITYDYNAPELSKGLMGEPDVEFIPPPQTLYDLGDYFTPFRQLFARPRNKIMGR